MNDVIQQMIERKSVRAFTDRPIAAQDKIAILTAATEAPTAGNQQLDTIIDVTDASLKQKLVKTCGDQPVLCRLQKMV